MVVKTSKTHKELISVINNSQDGTAAHSNLLLKAQKLFKEVFFFKNYLKRI
jgi:hypothetical protein